MRKNVFCLKNIVSCGILLGLLTGAAVAQRGRMGGPMGPTSRPNPTVAERRSSGASPTMAPSSTVNRGVSSTAAPNVSPTAAPRIETDPLAQTRKTASPNSTIGTRTAEPTAASPVRDPK